MRRTEREQVVVNSRRDDEFTVHLREREKNISAADVC